jgi:hypothetical protein
VIWTSRSTTAALVIELRCVPVQRGVAAANGQFGGGQRPGGCQQRQQQFSA